ncbi:MAG TPA: glycosyl hydrolase 115 family protein [Allosphingosinicella sp.]|nr:glycosyl hydrolase 115 family protein [Allosphingosinicella sp.]
MKPLLLLLLILWAAPALACVGPAAICNEKAPNALALIEAGRPVRIVTDAHDDPGVLDAAANLRADLGRVAGSAEPRAGADAIIVGTIGRDAMIDALIREHRLDVRNVAGRWEASVRQIVEHPAPGIARALVIAGADRRGTIFGIYDLSRRIGVSPWNWWADVPPLRHRDLYVLPGRRTDAPVVKYRGFFINDEDPALLGWAKAKFGGFNHLMYAHVFELLLRLRGNLLWPAMWGKSFYEDDPENARLAEEMGVVIGTSHHEPLMRAHVDWEHHGQGPWDYTKNAERLRAFWREGVERTQGDDRIVTIGMRGDGDKPMTQGTAVPLLERIVADQRKIIADVTHRPAAETPQIWALYKEVQDYYDAGMRVPDDVTLLFSDDNWGNLRRLLPLGTHRAGGSGIYYHFDYVGGPRNYKWIDTNQIERVWQQMRLADEYDADRLWIVNVGDIKPMEYPTNFFLDMAWNPKAMNLARMEAYPRDWAAEQFGPDHAAAIGDILQRYGQLIARRKPELLDANTYSLDGFEWDLVAGEWLGLGDWAEAVEAQLPAAQRDAYFELVLHRVLAAENLHLLYRAVAKNRRYAPEKDPTTNSWADRAEEAFARDAEIRHRYEVETAGGKWTQMMAQTHIGYTGWQQPDRDMMPPVQRIDIPKADEGIEVMANDERPRRQTGAFVERDGIVAIEAEHHAEAVGGNGVGWMTIPYLGRTLSGVTATSDTFAPVEHPGGSSPHLGYEIRLDDAGPLDIFVYASPGLDISGHGRQRYAVSIDGGAPRIVNLLAGDNEAKWARAVADEIRIGHSRVAAVPAGRHVVRLWLVDPNVVFQRLVVTRGPLPASYLGPPESRRR